MSTRLRRKPAPLCDRDPSDPARQAVELVQRGRMILDVAAADLEAAEAALGPFHPTAWHFRAPWTRPVARGTASAPSSAARPSRRPWPSRL